MRGGRRGRGGEEGEGGGEGGGGGEGEEGGGRRGEYVHGVNTFIQINHAI